MRVTGLMSRVTMFPLGGSTVPGWYCTKTTGRQQKGGEIVMITLVRRTGHAVCTALHWADDWTLLALNADPTLNR